MDMTLITNKNPYRSRRHLLLQFGSLEHSVNRLISGKGRHRHGGGTGSGLKQNYLARDFAFVEAIEALVYFFQLDGVTKQLIDR